MEKLSIGYIFTSAKVKYIDSINEFLILEFVSDEGKFKLLLRQKFIPDTLSIKCGMPLKNLVLIGYRKKGSYPVAIEKFWSKLIEEYYPGGMKPTGKWSKWYKRWAEEYGKSFKDNFTLEKVKLSAKENDKINTPVRSLYALKSRDYILPVFGCEKLNYLQGHPMFYPDVIYKNDEKTRYLKSLCIYKTDTVNTNTFPKYFQAKTIDRNNNNVKDVNIYLHGFCFPVKWHHCIWKHIFASTAEATASEKQLWEELWNTNIIYDAIHRLCQENVKGTSCDAEQCSNLSLFSEVHPKIADYCKRFLTQYVTSFKSESTNHIIIYNDKCGSNGIIFKYQIKHDGFYQYVKLNGICHNWDEPKPMLHLLPQTMYLSKRDKHKDWFDKKEIKHLLDKPDIVFEGTLDGVANARE